MKKFIIVLLILPFPYTVILPQESALNENKADTNQFWGSQAFLYDCFFFMSPTDKSMTRTELYIGFCNDILQFVKETEDRFLAKYELMIAIFDKRGNHLNGKTITENIIALSYPETNSRKITNRIFHNVELVADEYKLIVDLTDLDTKKTIHREQLIKVPGFRADKIGISDVIFADEIERNSSGIQLITPNLGRNFNDPASSFWAYCEVYPVSLADSLTITYQIIDVLNKPVIVKKESVTPYDFIIPYILNLKEIITFADKYVLEIEAEQKNIKVKTNRNFSISWSFFNSRKLDINHAIKPLKSYLNENDLKSVEQASDSIKREWFNNYWQQRDPTPETEENELKLEFYKRVDFANYNFSITALEKDGWETDRGKIYIKYGPPTTVDRRASELNIPPYEIWYYSSIERRFIFEDRSGIGDYTLVKIE